MKLLKIILIILIFGSIIYFLSNSSKNSALKKESTLPVVGSTLYALPSTFSEDIKDWKQYKSKNYNFSFYYPENYSVKEETRLFSEQKYPVVTIIDNKSGLQLIFDYKIEFGLTELGFSTDKYQDLKQKPHLIRFKENNSWTYYKKSSDGTCVSPDGASTVKDGENNILCYDVNFPNNWYYSVFIPEGTNTETEEIKNAINTFDKIVLTIKY